MCKMYCTTRLLRYILCVINLIYAINGSLLIWYGTWLLESIKEQHNNLDHGEDLAAILCILLGTVIILASIFGTVGLVRESIKMLISYTVLLLVLLIIQLIMFSISYAVGRESLPYALQQGFDEIWDPQYTGNSTLAKYEQWLHCCGRNNAEDYMLLGKEIPASCCSQLNCINPENLYMDGCEFKFKEYINHKTGNFHTLSWFLITIEFVGSIFACYLVDSIRNHRDRVRFYN